MAEDQGRGGRFCYNCGTELPHAAANFCANCGAAQDPAEAVEAEQSSRVPGVPPVTVHVSQEQSQQQYGCGFGCLVLLIAFVVLAVVGALLDRGPGGVLLLVALLIGGFVMWLQWQYPQRFRDFFASFRRAPGSSNDAPGRDPNYGRPTDPFRTETRRPEDDEPPNEN